MANIFVNIECQSLEADNVTFSAGIMIQFSYQYQATLFLPQSILGSNPSAINNQLIEKIKENVMQEYGISVGPGEKVLIFGGAV